MIGSQDRREKGSSKGTYAASGVKDKTKAIDAIKQSLLHAIEKSGEKDEAQSYCFQHDHDFVGQASRPPGTYEVSTGGE